MRRMGFSRTVITVVSLEVTRKLEVSPFRRAYNLCGVRKPHTTIIPTNNHTMYVTIVTRAVFNCVRRLNNFHFGWTGKESGLGNEQACGVAWRGKMSASAQQPG